LPPGTVENYEREGFLVLPEVIPQAEIDQLRRVLENPRIVSAMHEIGPVGQLFEMHRFDRVFLELAADPRVVRVAQAILGPDIQLQHCKLTYKSGQVGTGNIHWHQDLPFVPHSTTNLLSVFIYVDDATPDNGCMTVVTGSHREGMRTHFRGAEFTGQCEEPEAYADVSRHRHVEVRAGGLSVHHALTLHASSPSTSRAPRRLICFFYRPAGSVQLGGPVWSDTGRQITGSFDGGIRCEAGAYRVPPQPEVGSVTHGLRWGAYDLTRGALGAELKATREQLTAARLELDSVQRSRTVRLARRAAGLWDRMAAAVRRSAARR